MTAEQRTHFIDVWEHDHQRTLAMLGALPSGSYDFRPDATGRSVGELAWHLAEHEGLLTHVAVTGRFDPTATRTLPGLRRPERLEDLVPAFTKVHGDAVARVSSLTAAQLTARIPFIVGPTEVSELLWTWMLMANVHHRGQLSLLCRLAGGVAPGVYGPNREEMAAFGPPR